MTAAFDQALRKATFAFFAKNSPVVVGGTPYWIDSGPHGLNAAMNGFTAPAYGKGNNTRGRPYIRFDGSDDYCELPLWFYDHVSDDGMTFVVAARHITADEDDIIFDLCGENPDRGLRLLYPADERMELHGYDSGTVQTAITDSADVPLTGRTHVSVVVLNQLASLGAIYHDMDGPGATFAGSTNAINYDATIVPTIGAAVGGGEAWSNFDLYAFLCFPWVFSYSEADEIAASVWDWAVG